MQKGWKIVVVVLLVVAVALAISIKNKNASDDSPIIDQEATVPLPPEPAKPQQASEAPVQASKSVPEPKPVKLPRLLDLGADKCIPCKQMAPLLEELKKEYAGKLEVVFIDVWKDGKTGQAYGIRSIPTQIFYDADGKELSRHVGFFSKADILGRFKEHGIELGE